MGLAWWSRMLRFWHLAPSSGRQRRRAAVPSPRPVGLGIEQLGDRTLLSGLVPGVAGAVMTAYGRANFFEIRIEDNGAGFSALLTRAVNADGSSPVPGGSAPTGWQVLALAPVTGGRPGGFGSRLLHLLDAAAQTGLVRGGLAESLGNLTAGPGLRIATARFDFGSLLFFSDGKEEALLYRKGLYREDAALRSVNLFQDLLPRADPPLSEGPAATGPHEVNAPAESPILEVNPVGDRAVGTLRAFDMAEEGSGSEGPTDGAVVDALGIVGEDPAFRIAPDTSPPAPEVHLVPVEDRDQAVVPTLLAGAAPGGAESGATGPGGGEVSDLPVPATTVVVGVDPMPDESPAEGPGRSGPFTLRPQAIPDLLFGPWSSMRREQSDPGGEDPRSAAVPSSTEGGFGIDFELPPPGDGSASLLPPEIEAPVPALEPAVSAVSLLGLWLALGKRDPAGEDPARPTTGPHP